MSNKQNKKEIQEIYDKLNEINEKYDKMIEKLDEILRIEKNINNNVYNMDDKVTDTNGRVRYIYTRM